MPSIPGDEEPVLGELGQVPGCFVAFTHSGATLGLIAGELLAGEILTEAKYPLPANLPAGTLLLTVRGQGLLSPLPALYRCGRRQPV